MSLLLPLVGIVISPGQTLVMKTFYVPGNTARLSTSDGRTITIVVKRLCSTTVSPVMEVELQTPNGLQRAILKMFDRRFFTVFREDFPYNEQAEASWEEFVRSGKAEEGLRQRREAREEEIRESRGEQITNHSDEEDEEDEDDENDEDESDEEGDFETQVFWYHEIGFHNEVRAYSKLKELQGRCVPRFIDSVCYSPPTRPLDLPAKYFDIPGILIEYIPSFQMANLTAQFPDQPHLWKELICQAMDVATQINNAGVVTNNNKSWNYIVAQPKLEQFRVYMVDFSQATFQEQLKETEDPEEEDGWPYFVTRTGNPLGIGLIMKKRILNLTGQVIEIEGVTSVI